MDNLIVVTGYGQFYGHEINASEEAVKLLPKEVVVNSKKYEIKTIFISVEYEEVDKKVEEIWSLKPCLVIHCGEPFGFKIFLMKQSMSPFKGVHGAAEKIKLEKCSFNGFCLQDFRGKTLPNPVLCLQNSGKCRRLQTNLNVDKITKVLNESYRPMFEVSCDVGKYLCGYIYLKSLDIDPERSLFVHVPCINKPFTAREMSDAIFKIVEHCVMDFNERLS